MLIKLILSFLLEFVKTSNLKKFFLTVFDKNIKDSVRKDKKKYQGKTKRIILRNYLMNFWIY